VAEAQNRRDSRRLPPDRLARLTDPAAFAFSTTEELEPLREGIIGQERAVRAMEFGLGVKQPGYNLFITGMVGTGRTTYALTKLRQAAREEETPPDWCYVYNFRHPDSPMAISLPPGQGAAFRKDMEELVEDLKTEIKKAFESEEYERSRAELVARFEKAINAAWEELRIAAQQHGFAIQRTPTGIVSIPLSTGGEPLTAEEYAQLPEKMRETLATKSREVQNLVADTLRRVRNLEREARHALRELERETGLSNARHLIDHLREKYCHVPRVCEYLDQVLEDVVEHLDAFRAEPGAEEGELPPFFPFRPPGREQRLLRYQVNLLVDHSQTQGAPVVYEPNPTYYNLLGRVEYRGEMGTMVTDFTMVKPGSLHLANGGYLVLNALDLLLNPFSWQALKRALKTGQIRIENLGEQYGLVATVSLKPEPIPTRVKVVLIGSPLLYHILYTFEEDFRKLFKVRVDFDTAMDRTEENERLHASFIADYCRREGLLPFDPTGVARILDWSSRLAEHQDKLTTRFHELTEIITEASAWARKEGETRVSARHVERALEEKIYRSNRIEEKILELIREGTLMVTTEGQAVGQINGLAVLDLGDYSFGKPARITARVALGEKGVVNIERETEMSGPLHSKGVYILSAYLAGKYAQDKPLALSASLCFEQLYEEVEGDSASSAELYCLLSELAGVPLEQGIAVTGSVNQKGEIQPIGGVNQKIEGFYHVCKIKGLNGRQGVMIPWQNVKHLMLKEEVRRAVEEGRFHIWAVRTVDEGMEVLTGMPAGERQADGTYPEGTINYLVDRRLREMAETMRRFAEEKKAPARRRARRKAPAPAPHSDEG